MKSSSLKFLIISGLTLITLLIAKYPPIITFLFETTNFFPALCFRLYALLLAFLLFISFYGVGSFFCPILRLNRIPQNLQIPVYFFIGFFFSSSIVYFLGFLGIIKKEILIDNTELRLILKK